VTRKKSALAQRVDLPGVGPAIAHAQGLAQDLPWPDPDQALLEVDEDEWQDAETADLVAREHATPPDWD
jgi:hypothetical protein